LFLLFSAKLMAAKFTFGWQAAAMTAGFANGPGVGIVLSVRVPEAGSLLAYRYRTRQRPDAIELPRILVPRCVAVAGTAVRASWGGYRPIAAYLIAAFLARVVEVANR
jgi:hypothetical protein